jgi:predicted deacetylase
MAVPIIWSLHDVSPATIDRATSIVDVMVEAGVRDLAILIVPSGVWTDGQLETLRTWERAGHVLGAHGWTHRGIAPRGIYHRLHSALFSRDVAEHLGRSADEVREIVARGVQWFADAGLVPPRLYVPPAWALGAMPLPEFAGTSFRWVETLSGIYDVSAAHFRRLPLVGFEADTGFRAASLRVSNASNYALVRATRRSLRAAVHPHDFELRLAGDLRRLLASGRASFALEQLGS